MGTSLTNIGVQAFKKMFRAETVPLGQGVESLQDMVCDPPISNSTNIHVAEDEGNAQKRVDASAPTVDEYAGRPLLQPGNQNLSLMFNDVNGNFGRTDLTSFAMSLRTQGIDDCSSYRTCSIIDIIQFLEDKNTESRRAASQKILDVETFFTAHYQSQIAALKDHIQHQAARSEATIQEQTSSLQKAQAEVENTSKKLVAAESDLLARDKRIHTIQAELMEEKKRCSHSNKSHESTLKQMNHMKADLENKLRREVEAGQAKNREVQRLESINQEKDKASGELQSTIDRLAAENQKFKGLLAAIEKKSAQESLTSGSYTEGLANPSLLVTAAQTVDRAMDRLAKFLYDHSLMGGTPLKAPEMESLIGAISRARPGDFSRPFQVKHVWGHWICVKMFQGFEHVYFDVPVDRTSPWDLEKHALGCFQTFQQNKDVPSLVFHKECELFREFCRKMFPLVFPNYLIDDARLVDSAKCPGKSRGGFGGGWEEPGELKRLFLDVAKAVWLLHELVFSFNPPASVLRMGWGEPYDKEYHEGVIKDADNKGAPLEVVLMLRPGFRVRKSVIKSRVFLSKTP